MRLVSFYPQAGDVGKMHRFAPTAARGFRRFGGTYRLHHPGRINHLQDCTAS
jgi:hypothetical protein